METRIKNLEEKVIEIERRLSHLENSKKLPTSLHKKERLTLVDYLIKLREEKFFFQPKTAIETHTKLKELYPCDLNRVAVALLRLATKKELRITSKRIDAEEYKAYVW